jgi:orotidine-5'-phosphate decarboxylase
MTDVIVALDYASRRDALALVDILGGSVGFYKVGLELYTHEGPDIVRELRARGKRVFLDLKLHDIPNTVAGAVRAAADLEVDLLTIHTNGGVEMMRAAAGAAENRLALLGVTLLTSLSPSEVEAVWGRAIGSTREEVVRLATLARDSGLPGIVASPQEAEAVRRRLGPDLVIVTPGIRLPGGDGHDQSRVATPGEAARAGATYLVLGRAVTAARDPVAAMASVRAELAGVGV